jgi:integrase/recombinase XerD
VTHLRKMMLEELQRRNYAETTIDCYLRAVEDFSRHFNCSPDRLGPRHIREYQAALFQKRKFSPNTVAQHLAALRFSYVKTLKKVWSITETPYPKKAVHLPTNISQFLRMILSRPESTLGISSSHLSVRTVVGVP